MAGSSSIASDDCFEEFLRIEKGFPPSRQCIFFPVPTPLLDNSEEFYIPKSVAIGPHHFGKKDLRLVSDKAVAMRRMEIRIQKIRSDFCLRSMIVEKATEIEQLVGKEYKKKFNYSRQELARMVTADTCFIYEFILSYCRDVLRQDVGNLNVPESNCDSIFHSCRMNPMWKRILIDLLLFENQIPLRFLEVLFPRGDVLYKEFYEQLLKPLIHERGVGVFSWSVAPVFEAKENLHLLRAFYLAIVGQPGLYKNNRRPQLASANRQQDFLVPKLPSAMGFKVKGVKFRCIPPGTASSAISNVRFDEKKSTLWLPQLHVDYFRIALIRNFIAMEVTDAKYDPYPMTSFAIFMNELIDNGEDCRLLSDAGIIVPMLGEDEEVAKAFNSIMQETEMRTQTCESIDLARAGLREYLKKGNKILWSEFYSTHLSKPWQVFGLVAANIILILTAVQVFCLGFACNQWPWKIAGFIAGPMAAGLFLFMILGVLYNSFFQN